MHLLSAAIDLRGAKTPDAFPFSIPLIRAAPKITFESPVTCFVGENGSGKSTLMEAIAAKAGMITAGSDPAEHDPSLAALRPLLPHVQLTWRKKTRKGFFLRAEDYFGYVRRLAQTRADLERDLRAAEEDYADKSDLAKALGTGPYRKEIHALNTRYGGDLDARSHGESFLAFFRARFIPGGLYLLDEPEAALSPLRQLAFLSLIKALAAQDAQFVIATHSPILLAYPGATLLSFDQHPPQPVPYDDLEHVTLTRDFLNHREQFLAGL